MDQYVGELRMFAGTFAPDGWNMCDGSVLPISQYEVLYTLLGTTYGGDGVSTFAVPDLRGRVPVGQGTLGSDTYVIGSVGGTEIVTITQQQLPAHSHSLVTSTAVGDSADPTDRVMAAAPEDCKFYYAGEGATSLNAGHIPASGGSSLPHNNMQPYLAVNYIIALIGIFPSQG